MKQDGMSLIETLLTVAILMVICGSLIPLHSQLNSILYNSKLELYASEVAYQGALQIAAGGEIYGERIIDDVSFSWYYKNETICVEFQVHEERRECINVQTKLP